MKLLITKSCETHRVNKDYQTLLIVFDGSEDNTRPRGLRGNWQPKDGELLNVIKSMAMVSPTFAESLTRFVKNLDGWGKIEQPKLTEMMFQ